ncbi:hypothetical protein AGMMS50262_23130 [Bacteroidia bacterium]|nr:hypothetical protein AGMMS50262_23130 [Bacteroidia bacterium]
MIYGQKIQQEGKNVSFYLTTDTEKTPKNGEYYSLTLLIDNQSEDSVCIENFNKHIFHKFDYREDRTTFYWEYLTTYNQVPSDIVFISDMARTKKQISYTDINIVIPPKTSFTTDVYIHYPSFVKYEKGYYKLCLYYEKTNEPVAELLIREH